VPAAPVTHLVTSDAGGRTADLAVGIHVPTAVLQCGLDESYETRLR
jgi:hypothetical protein